MQGLRQQRYSRYLLMRPWEAYVMLVVAVVLFRNKCDASFRANRWQMVF